MKALHLTATQDKVTKNTYRFVIDAEKGISGTIYLDKKEFEGIVTADTTQIQLKVLPRGKNNE